MEDKLIKPKLTLNRNVNLADISSRLNVLAGKANTCGKDQIDNSKLTNKAEKVLEKKAQQITKTSVKSNAIDSIKSRDTDIQKTKKYNESKSVDSNKERDKTVKIDNKNKPKKVQQDQEKKQETQNIKEKPKENKTISFKGMLSKLRQLYPVTFPGDETKIVALKVGINKDIKENLELMKKLPTSITYLGKFLKWYTSSRNYRTITQIEGNARYDLSGQVVGVVTKEQAEDIQKRLEHTSNKLDSKVKHHDSEYRVGDNKA